jgi:hypothetical protein
MRTAAREPVQNQGLWQLLDAAAGNHASANQLTLFDS